MSIRNDTLIETSSYISSQYCNSAPVSGLSGLSIADKEAKLIEEQQLICTLLHHDDIIRHMRKFSQTAQFANKLLSNGEG